MRVELKESGVKQAMNMKEETVIEKHKGLEYVKKGGGIQQDKFEELVIEALPKSVYAATGKPVLSDAEATNEIANPSIKIDITEVDQKFFKSIGFDVEWLASIANRYNFDRFQYMTKFKAFRCYRGNNHLDWVSVNDLAMLNGKQELTEILLKHQPHTNKDKIIIKLPWIR